ncbi:MAG: Peptidylprolyl isomerase [Bacteroidota bacterium]|jgi:peptidyl-prolyl cis-trans isomerase SurA
MKDFKFVIGFILCLPFASLAQSACPIQIGPKKISAESFLQVYKPLLESDSITKENQAAFLSDYIDYQLKIVAAEQEKLAEQPDFKEEYASFRKELATPYLVDLPTLDMLVKQAYQRMKEEKKVSQILVKLGDNPTPADTLIAFQKIDNLYQKLKAGEDFATLATKFSEDELSAPKGGALGFITSLQTDYDFENAVYSVGIGEYSKPFRTPSGYHIIKINNQRPNSGKIRLAHIIVSAAVDAPASLQVEAKKKIEQVEAYLKAGESFELVCKNYSEDPYSRGRGGEIRRWYFSSDLSEELQDALFGLEKIGDLSKPIRTNLGWQLFKLVDKKPLLTYEDMSEFIKQKVLTDADRQGLIRQAFMKRVRIENKVKVQEAVIKAAFERMSVERTGSEPFLQEVIFSVLDKNYTVGDFYAHVQAQQKRRIKSLGYLPSVPEQSYLDELIEKETLQAEEANLESKYPAFKEQMAEFLEGSLFSKMTDREIFEKSLDSLSQAKFYQENKAQFMMPARVEAKLVVADTQKTLKEALDLLKQSPYPMNKKFSDISFALKESKLEEPASKLAAELFLTMAKNVDYVVEISGHRDASEADSLSEARVNKVVAYLNSKGISSQRIIQKDEANLKAASKTVKTKNARVSFRFFSSSMEDVVKRFNALKPGSLEAKEGYFKKGVSPVIDSVDWTLGLKSYEAAGKFAQVEIKKVEPERIRSFEEARGLVIRALQERLEKEWVAKLKQQYPVVINTAELEKILKN